MGNPHYFECPPFTVSKLYSGTCRLWLYYFYRENNLWFLSQNNWKAKSPGFGSWLWSVGFLSLLNRLCPLCISSSGWLGTGSLPGHTQPSSGLQPAKGRTRKNSLLDSSCLRLAANCQLPTDGDVLLDSKEVSQHSYTDLIFKKSLMDFSCPFSKLMFSQVA